MALRAYGNSSFPREAPTASGLRLRTHPTHHGVEVNCGRATAAARVYTESFRPSRVFEVSQDSIVGFLPGVQHAVHVVVAVESKLFTGMAAEEDVRADRVR